MSSFEAYILESDSEQKQLFQLARTVINQASPKMTEHFSYGVPFFSCYGKVCYFNRLNKGIDIAFVRGVELSDERRSLNGEGRKQVRSLRFETVGDYNEELLFQTLQEALVVDEYYNKKRADG